MLYDLRDRRRKANLKTVVAPSEFYNFITLYADVTLNEDNISKINK